MNSGLGSKARTQSLDSEDSEPEFNAWIQGLDSELEFKAWIQRLDSKPGIRAWIQNLSKGTQLE